MATPNHIRAERLPTWEELDRLTTDAGRYIDLCAVMRRNDRDGNPTGEILLEVGGQWDRIEQRYTGRDPARCKIWGINEAQLEAVDDLREYFDKRDRGITERNIIESLGGPRGSGKTDLAVRICAAFNLKYPGSKAWVFSPTLDKREEVEDFYRSHVPQKWARNQLRWPTSIPDCRFRLLNGSSTRSLTGEIPQNAKRGEAECIVINEGQQQRRKVFSLSLYGIRKNGGLLTVAHNPPDKSFPAGEWVIDLVESIEAKKYRASHRWMDPKKNPSVHSATMDQIGLALAEIDPASHLADVAGKYQRLGEFVYSRFRAFDRYVEIETAPGILVGAEYVHEEGTGTIVEIRGDRTRILLPSMVRGIPDIAPDITQAALKRAGWHGGQRYAIGTDHQTTPHQAAAVIQVTPHFDKHGKPTGKNVYTVVDECIVPGSSVTEVDLSDALYNGLSAGQVEYTPESAVLVPDCSGDWQVSNRESGMTSIKVLESQRWKCKPPTEILRPDRSKHPKNPPVHHSIAQMADVMNEGRFFVAPVCEWVIKSGPCVPYKKDGDRVRISQAGGYAHVWDCIRYVIWLLEPKRKRQAKAGASAQAGSLPGSRPGVNFRF